MGKVSVSLNGRAFTIGCEDGQEPYLRELARHLDGHIQTLSGQVGQIGDLRLLLMASLVVADELREAEKKTEALEAQVDRLKSDGMGQSQRESAGRDRAAKAINEAAARLEQLATEAGA